jgi:hypothetical protein
MHQHVSILAYLAADLVQGPIPGGDEPADPHRLPGDPVLARVLMELKPLRRVRLLPTGPRAGVALYSCTYLQHVEGGCEVHEPRRHLRVPRELDRRPHLEADRHRQQVLVRLPGGDTGVPDRLFNTALD